MLPIIHKREEGEGLIPCQHDFVEDCVVEISVMTDNVTCCTNGCVAAGRAPGKNCTLPR